MNNADRSAYIAGLHALAVALDAHPEVPLPMSAQEDGPLVINCASRTDLIAARRAIGGSWRPAISTSEVALNGNALGLHIRLTSNAYDAIDVDELIGDGGAA